MILGWSRGWYRCWRVSTWHGCHGRRGTCIRLMHLFICLPVIQFCYNYQRNYMYVLKTNYDDFFIVILSFYINQEWTLIYWLRSSRSKATCLNEFQKQCRFSCSRGSHNDNPAIGRQIWHQMILHFSIYPLPGKITTFIFHRMLSKYFSYIPSW